MQAYRTARWQVEQDEYCQQVLARHWPEAKRYCDVRDVGAHNLSPVDIVLGGFPCQDISVAGKGAGWRVKDPAYSLKSCAFVARWHPGSSVLRTSQLSIIGDWMPFSGNLPRSAIVYDMAIFEHPTWPHRTDGSDGLQSPGGSAWPNPTVAEAERGHGYQRSGDRLYPTLTGAVGATNHWPTPAAKPFDQSPEAFDRRRQRMKQKGYNGNGAGRLLAVEVRREWPTPAASLGTAGHISRGGKRSGELLLAGLAQAMDQKYPTGSARPTPAAGVFRESSRPESHSAATIAGRLQPRPPVPGGRADKQQSNETADH